MLGTNSARDRFARFALAMDFWGMSLDRIAEQSETAVDRRSAKNAGAILRTLGTAMDAARAGRPGALEVLALDAADVSGACAFLDAMEENVASVVPVFACDEQEGE